MEAKPKINKNNILLISKFYHKKLALIILGVIIGLSLTEILLRLVFFVGERQLFGFHPFKTSITWQDNLDIGNVLLSPNTSGWFVSPTKEYYTWIEANNDGLRDTDHLVPKENDTVRILILGDSFVQNFQVPLDKTFFKKLEENLKNGNQKKIEVIAVGLGNTGTDQQFIALEKIGLKYKPDLVIQMFFTGNDIKNNYSSLNQNPNLPYFTLKNDQLIPVPTAKSNFTTKDKIKKLLKNFYLVQLSLDLRQKLLEKPSDYSVYDVNYSNDYEKAWNITQQVILETKKITENAGGKYILVSLANNEQVNPDNYPLDYSKLDLEKPDILLESFCQKSQVNCLFMLPFFQDFKKQNPSIRTHYRLDGHWNEVGTNLAADFLTTNLSKIIKSNE